MRLDAEEVRAIREEVRARDAAAAVYLYGSRAVDHLRGGDIDLLVLSDTLDFAAKLDVLMALQDRLGEQRIDLTLRRPQEVVTDPFVRQIFPGAIRL